MQVSRDRKNVVLSKDLSDILDTELTGTSRKNWSQLLGLEEILSSLYLILQAFNYLSPHHHDHYHHHDHHNHQGHPHHPDHHHHQDHLWL